MTRDDKRLARVWTTLVAHSKGERVHLPVIDDHDAGVLADLMHDEVDRGTAGRAAAIASEGFVMACQAGCNACCANVIMVYQPEAALVADWLSQPENAVARATFLAAYPAWLDQAGTAAQVIRALHARGRTDDAQRAYDKVQELRVMCAFNHEGNCSVYPVRPNVCRNTHALDTAERCAPNASPGPHAMAYEPLEKVIAATQPILRAVQTALLRNPTAGALPEAMCIAVHRRLTQPAPAKTVPASRNAACPCGSGEKYKRCCGS